MLTFSEREFCLSPQFFVQHWTLLNYWRTNCGVSRGRSIVGARFEVVAVSAGGSGGGVPRNIPWSRFEVVGRADDSGGGVTRHIPSGGIEVVVELTRSNPVWSRSVTVVMKNWEKLKQMFRRLLGKKVIWLSEVTSGSCSATLLYLHKTFVAPSWITYPLSWCFRRWSRAPLWSE